MFPSPKAMSQGARRSASQANLRLATATLAKCGTIHFGAVSSWRARS